MVLLSLEKRLRAMIDEMLEARKKSQAEWEVDHDSENESDSEIEANANARLDPNSPLIVDNDSDADETLDASGEGQKFWKEFEEKLTGAKLPPRWAPVPDSNFKPLKPIKNSFVTDKFE